MRWVKVATEMSSLVSMLFRTFLNPLKFLMEIFNILVYVCMYVCMYLCMSLGIHYALFSSIVCVGLLLEIRLGIKNL